MSVSAELKSVTRNFLEQLLVCRPTDAISFAVQYYSDERAAAPLVSHAVHSLMFLLRRPSEFRSAVGTIFCAEFLSSSSKSSKKDASSAGSSGGSGSAGTPAGGETPTATAAESAQPAAPTSSTTGESDAPTGEDDAKFAEGQSSAAAAAADSDESAADAKTAAKKEASNKLQNLYKVARCAIRNAYSSVPNNAGAGAGPNHDGGFPEPKDWMCSLIEAALGGEAIAKTAAQDFEACVAFLRSYLSLRIITGRVFESVALRAQLSTYLHKEKGDAAKKTVAPAMEITSTACVRPEDVELIEQIINATIANHQPGSEKFTDVQKTVSLVVNQYMSLLRTPGT